MALTFGGKRRPGGFGPRTPLDPLEQQVTDRIAAVMRALGNGVDIAAYEEAIRALDPDRLERLLAAVTLETLGNRIEEVLRSVVLSGASAEAARIIRENPRPAVSPATALEYPGVRLPSGVIVPTSLAGVTVPDVEFQIGPDFTRDPETGRLTDTRMFTYVDNRATDYARVRAAGLVREIDTSNRLAIRQTVTRAFTGTSPDVVARDLRKVVGLHSRWANAVLKNDDKVFRALLKDGLPTDEARARADVLTKRYRDRLIRRRAEMIARTEIQQAQNYARQAAWDAGNRTGYVDGQAQKEWVTAPAGSRYGPPCEICTEMKGRRVPWNGAFPSGHTMPPAHPHCRCTAVLVPPSRGLTALPTQDLNLWLDRLDADEAVSP